MKLRNLKGAIRKVEGPVRAKMHVPALPGVVMDVGLVKSDLMAALDTAFNSDGQAETGFRITDEGFLDREHHDQA